MSPVIRIDDKVYSWLQKNARPFEDTPNNVLRRIAGLDPELPTENNMETDPGEFQQKRLEPSSHSTNTAKPGYKEDQAVTGKLLNDRWRVKAKHALYHRDGIFYNNLDNFPGALFDPDGYLLFRTESEYLNCPYLKIGESRTNVPKGIYSVPGYIKKR